MLKIKLTLKQKIILTYIAILVPIITFIYIVNFNTLSKNLLDNSLEYLLKESNTMGGYIENLLEANKNPNKEEVFKSISPFIATNLSNRFNIRVQTISNSGQITYDSDKNQISLYNKDIDKAIEEIVEVVPEYQCLTSIPGVVKFTLQELSLKLDRLNVLKIILKSLNMRA